MGLLAGTAGFLTFLALMPARCDYHDFSGVLSTEGSARDCYTHLGWQDVLGPASGSRWAAALVGLLVGLTVLGADRLRERRRLQR